MRDSLNPQSRPQVGKSYAARAARAAGKREAEALAAEGLERVSAVYTKGATAVDGLKDMAKALRRLPVVDLGLPTVPAPCPEARTAQARCIPACTRLLGACGVGSKREAWQCIACSALLQHPDSTLCAGHRAGALWQPSGECPADKPCICSKSLSRAAFPGTGANVLQVLSAATALNGRAPCRLFRWRW